MIMGRPCNSSPFLSFVFTVKAKLICPYDLGQNIWNKVNKLSKLNKARELWYLLLHTFWLLLPQFNFLEETLGTRPNLHPDLWFFQRFPNFWSFKSFGCSWDNLYTTFFIMDFKFRFTCSESDLYQNIRKFRNIMTRLYVLIISCMHFRVNPHSIVAWMSRNSLLETGAKSEV